MNEELILNNLQEIKDNQREICRELASLNTSHAEMKMELALSRNGFTPHEIVSILHFANDQRQRAEAQSDNIRRALVGWIVPILCSALVAGLVLFIR